MPPVRRLPVLQNASTDEDERPGWHWIGIGVVFVLCIWVPLAIVAGWAIGAVAAHMLDSPAEMDLGHPAFALLLFGAPVASFGFSCWAAGGLVGRFGTHAGPREAALSGGLAALVGSALTLMTRTTPAVALASLLVLVPIGVALAWIGGRFGVRRRAAATLRAPPPPSV